MGTTKFNPEMLAQMTFKGKGSTESFPVPIADYIGTVDSFKLDTWESEAKGTSGMKLLLMWDVPGDATIPQGEHEGKTVESITGRVKNLVKQEMFLDTTEDGTGLDFGKGMNVQLNRTREAFGLNSDEEWAFEMFVGKQAKINIGHVPDKKIPGRVFAEVKAVAAL